MIRGSHPRPGCELSSSSRSAKSRSPLLEAPAPRPGRAARGLGDALAVEPALERAERGRHRVDPEVPAPPLVEEGVADQALDDEGRAGSPGRLGGHRRDGVARHDLDAPALPAARGLHDDQLVARAGWVGRDLLGDQRGRARDRRPGPRLEAPQAELELALAVQPREEGGLRVPAARRRDDVVEEALVLPVDAPGREEHVREEGDGALGGEVADGAPLHHALAGAHGAVRDDQGVPGGDDRPEACGGGGRRERGPLDAPALQP